MTKQKKPGVKKPVNAQKAPAQAAVKPASKLGRLEAMLRRPDGATIEQLSKALDWQAHSVRGSDVGCTEEEAGPFGGQREEGGRHTGLPHRCLSGRCRLSTTRHCRLRSPT